MGCKKIRGFNQNVGSFPPTLSSLAHERSHFILLVVVILNLISTTTSRVHKSTVEVNKSLDVSTKTRQITIKHFKWHVLPKITSKITFWTKSLRHAKLIALQ